MLRPWDTPLARHPFTVAILKMGSTVPVDLAAEVEASIRSTGDLPRRGSRRPSTAAEAYHSEVSSAALRLDEGFHRLYQAEALVVWDPSGATGYPSGLSRGDWIDYHVASHQVQTVAMEDLACILINAVLQLGHRSQDCRPRIIARNRKLDVWAVTPALRALSQAIRPFRESRNALVHRGGAPAVDETIGSAIARATARGLHHLAPGGLEGVEPGTEAGIRAGLELQFEVEAGLFQDGMQSGRRAIEASLLDLYSALLPRLLQAWKSLGGPSLPDWPDTAPS